MTRRLYSIDWKALVAATPGFVVALLPALACPACWAAYAGVVATLGLGFLLDRAQLLALTIVLFGVAIASFTYHAKRRHGYGPAVLGSGAAALILMGKFALEASPLWYAGAILFLGAALWNAWPRRSEAAATCPSCAGQDQNRINEAHSVEVQR